MLQQAMAGGAIAIALLFGTAKGLAAQNKSFDPRQDDIKRHFNLGLQHLNHHSYEAAIESLLSALRLDNANERIRYHLGLAFYKAGRTHLALEQWQNILKLGGPDPFLSEKVNHVFYMTGQGSRPQGIHKDYVYVRSFFDGSQAASGEEPLGLPTGLLVDETNALYVVDFARHIFWRVGPNGKHYEKILDKSLASSIASRESWLNNPYQVVLDDEGVLYISDFGNDRVVGINRSKRVVKRFGRENASDPGYLLGPEGMAIDDKGNVFVSDTGNSRIHYYNNEGQFLFSFGERGTGKGQLQSPSGLLFDPSNKLLYVCDKGNDRMAVFDASGTFLRNFGAGFLRGPRQVLFTPRGEGTLTLLDAGDVYHYDLRTKEHASVFHGGSGANNPQTKKPLSMAYSDVGFLVLGDGEENKVDLYSPVKLLYANLFVQVERVYLRDFPKILLTVSVHNKEGLRMSGLTEDNFEVHEDGVRMLFQFNDKPKQLDYLRPVVLFEASLEAEKRRAFAKDAVQGLYESFSEEEWSKVYRYGSEGKTDEPTSFVVSDYNNSVLEKSRRTIEGPYYSQVFVGTALKRAIADNLKHNHKKGVVVVVFQSYSERMFEPEQFDVLVDYAAHNGVPVYILYAGEAGARRFPLLNDLARRTGGAFHAYENKATLERLVRGMRGFRDGQYDLQYSSFRDDLNKGQFRKVKVGVRYHGLVGEDIKAGYAIP